MKQKKQPSPAFDCLAVTDVEVKALPSLPGASHIKGVAQIVLTAQMIIRGLRIMDGTSGLFVSYPIDQPFEGESFQFLVNPITRQLREHIENCVLEKYQDTVSEK